MSLCIGPPWAQLIRHDLRESDGLQSTLATEEIDLAYFVRLNPDPVHDGLYSSSWQYHSTNCP